MAYLSSRYRNRRSKHFASSGGGGGGGVLLDEPFDDNSNSWGLGNPGGFSITGGELYFGSWSANRFAECAIDMAAAGSSLESEISQLTDPHIYGTGRYDELGFLVLGDGITGALRTQVADGYFVFWKSEFNTLQIRRRVAGVENTVTVGAATYPSVGDTIKIEVTDTGSAVTIKAFVNDVQVATDYVDNSPPASRGLKCGVYMEIGNNGGPTGGYHTAVTDFVMSEL